MVSGSCRVSVGMPQSSPFALMVVPPELPALTRQSDLYHCSSPLLLSKPLITPRVSVMLVRLRAPPMAG